ncbi:hypothetical protein [Winogradskya consettensis]|uniref:hypothetical protein n=1 Tax=Winogradskya consettensis TaxID=113560 RepID=UPI0034DB73CC
MVICDGCGRRAESQWAYNRPAYRCRHGRRGARSLDSDGPFHAREDRLVSAIAVQLDLNTGQGQTLWSAADIAAYLRTYGLTVRCTSSTVVIDGTLPPAVIEAAKVEQLTDVINRLRTSPIRHRKAAPPSVRKRRIIRRTKYP